jgi:glyoxylase-like metal-dependent hydrolase (beta-lactamase superfamily II)
MEQSYSYHVIRGLCNSIILVCEKTKKCAIIDPSIYDKIVSKIDELKVTPEKILLTHGHYDHIFYAQRMKETYLIEVHSHESEEEYVNDAVKNHSMESMGKAISFKPDRLFYGEKGEFFVGALKVKFFHTPGHTKGSVSYFIDDSIKPILFSGDTLFNGTIGRTDLYGGNFSEIIDSIEKKLLVLPEETIVIPGHGHNTKIMHEKENIELIKRNLLK